MQMKVARYAIPVVVAALVMALGACASTAKAPKDKDLIAKTVGDWKTAVEASNLDAMLTAYSEDFKGERGGKPELKTFLKDVIDKGYLKGAKVDLTKAALDIKKDTATYTPIYLSGSEGSVTIQLTLKKEKDKAWRIIASDNS
jgi:ketosteroid isomerase-like protein